MKKTIKLYTNRLTRNLVLGPVLVYSELILDVKSIFKNNKGKSGIY